jgi:hypothetical protein
MAATARPSAVIVKSSARATSRPVGPLNQMLTDLAVGDKTDRSVSIRCRLVSAKAKLLISALSWLGFKSLLAGKRACSGFVAP